MLELSGVSKAYGQLPALCEVDLIFSQGLYAVLGHNGAGKTTLLRILAGILRPNAGLFKREGRSVGPHLRNHRDRTGYLPQDFTPYPDLTVEQLLRYMAGLKNIPASLVDDRVDQLLQQVWLKGERRTLVRDLSGGMIRQLGLVASLLNDPDLVLLDEPFTGLDAFARQRINGLLREQAAKRTVIISSHVTTDVEGMADYVIILKEGRVKAFQRPEQMILRLAGRVWEVSVGEEQLAYLQRTYTLPRIRIDAQGYRVRIVGSPPAHMVSRPVSPQLEDVYLAMTEEPAS